MRQDFSPQAVSALVDNPTYLLGSKLVVYKSRADFWDYIDDAPTYAKAEAFVGNPLPEATVYIPSISKMVTINEVGGHIRMLVEGNHAYYEVTFMGGTLICAPGCRPGIVCDEAGTGNNYIFWFDGDNWIQGIVDTTILESGNGACITDAYGYISGYGNGAIYPLNHTESVIYCFQKGGVRPVFVDSDLNGHVSPARFMNPIAVINPSTSADDQYLVHYGGAAKVNGSIFAYYSHYDGSVKCIQYTLSGNGKDGSWSDIQTCIPQDLSKFQIGNVFSVGSRVFICGRFSRKEEFATSTVWTLLCWSDNGTTFSMDRRVLCSNIDLRFLATFDGVNNIVFSSTNRINRQIAPYQLVGENTTSTSVGLVSVQGSPSGEFSCKLKAGKDEYINTAYITTGSYCRLDIGVYTGDDFEWEKYHDCVISKKGKGVKDGARNFSLNITPDGTWHTSKMSYPFYMEFQGREPIYDQCVDFSNMYKMSAGIGPSWALSCDFWVHTPGTNLVNGIEDVSDVFQVQTHNATDDPDGTDNWGPDIKTFCDEYPIFGAADTYKFKIYGWSRAGVPDKNPNEADTTPTDTNNDFFYALIEIQRPDGSKETLVSAPADVSSTYKHPPQTYFDEGVRDGSYPVIYDFPNPGAGCKILKIGCRVIAPDNNTTYYLERVEMPGVTVYLSGDGMNDPSFKIVKNDDSWKLVEIISLNVTTGNATNGNLTTGTYQPNKKKCYAALIVGAVSFTRGGEDYVQSAQFETHGSVESLNQAIDIHTGDNPIFTKTRVTWEDSLIPSTKSNFKNYYLFHIDESTRELDTTIPAKYVPYFYSDGHPISVAFHCAGSGSISNIDGNPIKIYLFESPEDFKDFKYYSPIPSGSHYKFEIIEKAGTTGTHVVGGSYEHAGTTYPFNYYNKDEFIALYGCGLRIKNNNPFPISMRGDLSIDTYFVDYSQGSWLGIIDNPFLGGYPPEFKDDVIIAGGWTGGIDNHIDVVQHFTMNPGAYAQLFFFAAHPNERCTLEFTVMNFDSQVPVPSSFILSIPTIITVGNTTSGMVSVKKGIPQILFSSSPYTAFNYEMQARYTVQGQYSIVGLIGLATDEKNFILGFINPGKGDTQGKLGLAVIRNGKKRNIILDSAVDIYEGTLYDIRFWHRDGLFGFEWKYLHGNWPERGSMVLYEWDIVDGPLAKADDVFHIGAYTLIDPPRFRITGMKSTQGAVGVLPIDKDPVDGNSNFLSENWPNSGQIDIENIVYDFLNKYDSFDDIGNNHIMGPFQLRNIATWNDPFNTDPDGTHSYQGGRAIEFTQFRWLVGDDHAGDYADRLVASSAGYVWLNQQTMWKVWITTGGQIVLLRNRARYYSDSLPDYTPSGSEKVYVTNGLTGITLHEAVDQEYYHPIGAFCYLHQGDETKILGFLATNGDHDLSITSLLEIFCEIAGTHASFPGDIIIDAQPLGAGESVDVNE